MKGLTINAVCQKLNQAPEPEPGINVVDNRLDPLPHLDVDVVLRFIITEINIFEYCLLHIGCISTM